MQIGGKGHAIPLANFVGADDGLSTGTACRGKDGKALKVRVRTRKVECPTIGGAVAVVIVCLHVSNAIAIGICDPKFTRWIRQRWISLQ